MNENQLFQLYDLPRREEPTEREIKIDLAVRVLNFAKRFGKVRATGTLRLSNGQQINAHVESLSGNYHIELS